MAWYINDTEEWVDFFGEQVTAVPFIVNYACGFLALAFFNESALNELQESGNVSIDKETEKDPFGGYTFTKVSIIFKDKETDEKIAECIATGPNWGDISFKVYRDYSGKPSFFDMEIGKMPEEITTYPDENMSEVTKESSYTQQSPPSEQLPIGTSRSNPFPRTGIISTQNWDIKVLEIKRGVGAWDDIKAANMFNEPPPKGWEYLLVKLWVKCTANDSEVHYIDSGYFKVTGDKLIRYSSAAVVEPEPQLDAKLYYGGETEGWVAFLVGKDENNLILIFDDVLSFSNDNVIFIALDDNASIQVPPELYDIKPTSIGTSRAGPAPFGETVTTENWQVKVVEVARGEKAWEMVQQANMFNDPPKEGMEYVVVKIKVRYISTQDKHEYIDDSYFKTTGNANVLYDLPLVVEPHPALDVTLYPGGEYEGWVVLQAKKGETGLMLVFEPLWDFSDRNRRFLSLEK